MVMKLRTKNNRPRYYIYGCIVRRREFGLVAEQTGTLKRGQLLTCDSLSDSNTEINLPV